MITQETAKELLEAAEGVIQDPRGCPMCDPPGVLRNENAVHYPYCRWMPLNAAIAKAKEEEAKDENIG